MDAKLPPLTEVLGRLPWYGQLTDEHRANMLAEFSDRLMSTTTREEFTERLRVWSGVAHEDAKWSRLRLLQDSGLLPPNRAA
jgi:hypothetical protein